MPQPKSALIIYHTAVSRVKDRFPCPDCSLSLLPKAYESHCTTVHQVLAKLGCVWCRKVTWRSGAKGRHADHLLQCFKAFFITPCTDPDPKPPSDTIPKACRLLHSHHLFPEQDFFGHSPLPASPLWPLECSFPKTFQDDALHLASAYVRTYLQLHESHDWLHVMVKAVAIDSFVRALDADAGTTRTLLFFCWCNGGAYTQARHRQHRHMIVVSPKGHFEQHVWPHVVPEDTPCPRFASKRLKRIISPLHLVNTLGYLSHRKSRCRFSFDTQDSISLTDHHFYLHKTLPAEFKLPLALLWPEGVYQLLYQEHFQNIAVSHVARLPMHLIDGQWKQKIKYFDTLERGLVLPVLRNLAPTEEVTPHAFHLMGGQTLHFQHDPEYECLEDDTWLQKQATGGNCFYDRLDEAMWTPRPRDQALLHVHKPVVNRNEQLVLENARLKQKYETLEAKHETLEANHGTLKTKHGTLERMNGTWKRKYKTLERMNGNWKRKYRILEANHGTLKAKHVRFQQNCAKEQKVYHEKMNHLHIEIQRLNSVIHQLNQEEKAQLKLRIEQLESEMEKLKTENETLKKTYQ